MTAQLMVLTLAGDLTDGTKPCCGLSPTNQLFEGTLRATGTVLSEKDIFAVHPDSCDAAVRGMN